MTKLARNILPVAAVLTVALTLGACSPAPGRIGGDIDPVTLSAVWGNGATGIGSDVLDALAADRESAVTVARPTSPDPLEPEDEEGSALDTLAAGDADVSVIRSDRLATAGAASLAVLQAPRVVVNAEQAMRIATGPLAEPLMADLADIGLVGLALAPGGQRYLFGYGETPLTAEALDGAVLNARAGDGVASILEAFGATVDHSVGDDRSSAARSGSLQGIETSLQQFQAVDRPAVMMTDLALYEKFDVVVVRSEVYENLTEAQRSELRARAARAVQDAVGARETAESGLAVWCGSTGASAATFDEASHARLAGMLDEVTAELAAGDADVAAQLAALRESGDGTTSPDLEGCEAAAVADDFLVTPVGDQSVLDGVWRVEVSVEDFEAAGANFHDAQANAGVWTFDISAGRAEIDQPSGPDCLGQFAVAGDQISLDWMPEPDVNDHCYGQSRGTFAVAGDTIEIRWERQRDYDVLLDQALFQHGMLRVG